MNKMELEKLRPYLWHLTHAENVKRIRSKKRLDCTATLLRAAGMSHSIRERRECGRTVCVGGEHVHIRDQSPLHRKNMKLCDGLTFEDFVEYLNGFVFFWPGVKQRPKGRKGYKCSGSKHFRKYAEECPAVIRIPKNDLFAANHPASPLFSRYNSRSPRCSGGSPIPRGLDTFTCMDSFRFPSEVVEVVFREKAILPDTSEVATIHRLSGSNGWTLSGEWKGL